MQINELTTLNKLKAIKAIRDTTDAPNGAHIDMALQSSLGGRYLGHGVFGAAYEGKKPQHVYKVYNDPTYHEFAKFAKDNHHIYSALPKIHAIGKTKPTQQTGTTMPVTSLGVVKMERLKAIGGSDRDRHLMYLTNMLGAGNMRAKDYPELVNNSQSGRAFASDFPHLHSALSLISKHFPNATLDVHQQNIMKRPSSNEYVLSDPIAGHNNSWKGDWGEPLEEMMTLNKLDIPTRRGDIADAAFKFNMSQIGHGYEAQVFDRPKSKTVVRVGAPSRYSEFINHVRKNTEDTSLPKIYSHKFDDKTGTVITNMERLYPLDRTKGHRDRELMDHLYQIGEHTGQIVDNIENKTEASEALRKFDPEFHKTYHKFAKAFHNINLDLHPGNIMKRENGQYVITDLLENTELAELTTLNKSPVTTKIEANIKAQPGMGVTRVLGGNKAKSRFLGKGVFGAVYKTKNAPESVTKVFKDPAYLDFARYAKDNQDDPHMPRIYSIKHDPKTGISAVRMEKLISSDEHRKVYGYGQSEGARHVQIIANHQFGLDVSNTYLNPDHRWVGSTVRELKDNYPTVHDSLSNLASVFPNHKFDLHPGNIMYREHPVHKFSHQMVFTDPFVDPDALNVAQGKKPKKKLMEMITLNKALKGAPSGRLRGNEIDRELSHQRYGKFVDQGNDVKKFIPHPKSLLGVGEFGAVYQSGSHNKVVKVADDPAYHEFARYAMAHPEDPHLPKIHSIKKAGNVAVYRMEKLHYFEPDGFTPEPSANNDAIYGRTTAKAILDDISSGTRHMKNTDVLERVHSGVDWGVSGHFKRLAQHHPTIATSLHNIWTHFPEHQFDLGSANMMHRHNPDGSKTVVFTDPIYSKDHLMEDEGGGTLPTNNVGSGHIAGVGIGPDGEPPMRKKPTILRRKKLLEMITLNKLPVTHAFRSEPYPYVNGPIEDHYPKVKRLGAGAFASVYERQKNNSVIKVYGKDPEQKRGGYHEFLQHAKANQDDPHMPRIYASKEISPTVGAVRMERLHPITSKHPLHSILWQIGTHDDAIHKLAYISSLSDSFKKLSQHPKAPRLTDISPFNMMLRHNPDGTQTPVITDPWGG